VGHLRLLCKITIRYYPKGVENMRKMLSILLITSLILASSVASFGAAATPNDVVGTKYETAVSALVSAGVVSGYPDGTYKPLDDMNRAEACKILVTALTPALNQTDISTFSDANTYVWASQYIGYSVRTGIVNGYSDNTFKPGNEITLSEMITMVVRALGYKDNSLSANWPIGYINKATDLGILNGVDLTTKYANRGTAAIILYNAFILNGNLSGATDVLGVVISINTVATGDLDKLTIINSEGVTGTYNIPKNLINLATLSSGDIIAYGTDSTGKIDAIVKKEATYAYGKSFAKLATYNGVPVSSDAKVFNFGIKKDFTSSKAAFTSSVSDYAVTSLRLMDNVSTPAYYVVEAGIITSMIVPSDVGYTGRAYGMVLDTYSAANIEGKSVGAIDFLLGANDLQILTNGTATLPALSTLFDGDVYEVALRNGVAYNIATSTSTDPTKLNTSFTELTDLNLFRSGGYRMTYSENYMEITDVGADYIIVDTRYNGLLAIELSTDAVINIVTYDGVTPDGYDSGSRGNLRVGLYVRAFHVTTANDSLANILIVGKYAPDNRT
jgi:hypothetical protein